MNEVKEYLKDREFTLYEAAGGLNIHPQQNQDKSTNYFNRYRPEYICIYDSYNNPFFPYPHVIYDKATFDLPDYEHYLNQQIGFRLQYLPFHFYVEYIKQEYYIFNTRPTLMKPLLPNIDQTVIGKYITKNKKLIKYPEIYTISNIQNAIHICILGDSNSDVYDKSLYIKLKSLINSIYLTFKLGSKITTSRLIYFTGKNFYIDTLLTI